MKNGPKGKGLHLFLIAILLVADQAVKTYLSIFPQGEVICDLLPGFFNIKILVNPGIAFGILNNLSQVFIWVNTFILISFLVYFLFGLNTKTLYLSFALIIAGAASNLIDRLIYGGVVDYLNFTFFPTFNLADSYITVAICLMLKDAIFRKE
ncbi:MAG: signal peptidase II [Candidatus Kaelpia imicola]|nr:signal peptidase II [Candidatus Kaelpia imicola]